MYRVLIVDDMEIMRKLMRRMKFWGSVSGFELVAEAENGADALQVLQEQAIDVVITDIRMPKVDGLELLQQITTLQLCRYVILVSEHSDFEYARKGIQYGAYDYLVKPVNEANLQSVLLKIEQDIPVQNVNNNNQFERQVQTIQTYLKQGKGTEAIAVFTHILDDLRESDKFQHNINISTKKLYGIYKDLASYFLEHFPWLSTITTINRYSEIMDSINWQQDMDKSTFNYCENVVSDYIKEMAIIIEHFQYTTGHNPVIQETVAYILSHIDEEINVAQIAGSVHVNISYLSNLFRQKTKMTIKRFILRVKIERAKILLLENKLKNYEIAERLGYKDYEYFAKVFKKHTGQTLTEFRQDLKKIGE
ncbi:response regulator transcription factor [Desulfuribacillus alkaliarsenatis]|uniref:DNA-binding response regulator n=1 Tax=Desulfuribacillus alkaliarsenatis TaxID=766136 RepID=A0A1E5G3M2_9FIRM|nr:response regulator [Desulfuribacillus alkaliarsenatis]OEF97688.1 hypothetical protein BHF68_14400 [Desulfuribacillus alkaliarsenatis]